MDTQFIYELIGYIASILVAVSLMMNQIVKLRLVNLIGALAFSIYGFLIDSMPVALMNAFIVGINIYYLIGMFKLKSFFKVLKVPSDDEYLKYFLDFYLSDIRLFQPNVPVNLPKNSFNLMILRDMIPAGLFSARVTADGILTVDVDYVIPKFRDFKTGKFLFKDQIDVFKKQKIREIYTFAFNKTHIHYLLKIGFIETDEQGKFKLLVQ
jgi:hypothetical protein